ncbi:hypothetical protein GUJ93_ZPchr0002g24272 [Zizania palustris]|uniref:Uncharacterized protein n=1 Tax=Zizania palustris TaxID=103762 RepID=A0A8J5V596_ZIZPA|nr:hypothetical protein GUJ93_ZPchr0002g24272 [Zizania palustris]
MAEEVKRGRRRGGRPLTREGRIPELRPERTRSETTRRARRHSRSEADTTVRRAAMARRRRRGRAALGVGALQDPAGLVVR